MNYQVFEGEGRPDAVSYYLYNSKALAEIPKEVFVFLNKKQIDYISNLNESLDSLIKLFEDFLSQFSSIPEWVNNLKTKEYELEIHVLKKGEKIICDDIWLRFLQGEEFKPGISLREYNLKNVDYIPGKLGNVYKYIGETNHYGYLLSGGLQTPSYMFTGGGKLNGFYKFYNTRTGNSYCYDKKNKVYFYNHETDNYKPNDASNVEYRYDIDDFLIKYFAELITGQEL